MGAEGPAVSHARVPARARVSARQGVQVRGYVPLQHAGCVSARCCSFGPPLFLTRMLTSFGP